jgi:Ser/Thr protein kinase RdoA (MazF antagonist)
MSPEVHRLFSSEIRDQSFSRFRVTDAHLISERHSFIFDAKTSTGPCVLKVAHPSHRTYEHLEAEVAWLSYLIAKGVRAPRNHRSINSLFIERRIIQDVKELPSSQFQYGLIHADVYQENMFLADGELLLFDFDNCEYGHYISDIAIALYAALWRVPNEAERAEFSERFLRSLFAGYREEHQLSGREIEALPLFLQLREVLIYTVARKMLDLNNLTPIQARLLTERGDRIRKNQPIVDLRAVPQSL